MAETLGTIAAIAGGIVLCGNVFLVIGRWIKPALDVKKVQEDNVRRIEELEKHEAKDLEKLDTLVDMCKANCLSNVSILNHMIDGNGVERMKKTRDDINELLIKL